MPVSKKRRSSPKRKQTRGQRPSTARREADATCVVIAYEPSFEWIRTHESLDYSDYDSYLNERDQALNRMRRQGTEIYLTAFDYHEYLLYCQTTGHDPESEDTRSSYITHQVQSGHARYWEESVSEFLEAVEIEEYGWTEKDYAKASAVSRDLSSELDRLIEEAPQGASKITLATTVAQRSIVLDAYYNKSSEELQASEYLSEDLLELHAALFEAVLRSGGLTLRTPTGVVLPDGTVQERVRGWQLGGGEAVELDEASLFSAYCTDADTGEPLPPEHGVLYG